VVCGAANNQLRSEDAAVALAERGIVYAPDYVVNAGGIINIAEEWAPGGYSRDRAYDAAARIGDTTRAVLAQAQVAGVTTSHAADDLARARIRVEGGPPYRPSESSVMRDALLARRERFR
jgi:glutamate dehydrogenase/leucine dehydrogenase